MTEFTGERVVPGLVPDELWNEHFSRYAFASTFAEARRVLDVGCGTGYGAAELAQTATSVEGIDSSAEAIEHARTRYPLPNLRFQVASAESLPFGEHSFDLVVSFEVIEHLPECRGMLGEARRVLAPEGVLLVSTPNKVYYTESRGTTGANPYHLHEFEFAEFVSVLKEFFPAVTILLQNRVSGFAFYPYKTFPRPSVRIDTFGGSPAEAHFFIALCTQSGDAPVRTFVHIPRAENLVREREQHIALLEQELAKNRLWLAEMTAERNKALELLDERARELEERGRWGHELESLLASARERVVELQNQLQSDHSAWAEAAGAYQRRVEELEKENRERTEWAQNTDSALKAKIAELADAARILDERDAALEERTRWAQELDARVRNLEAQLSLVRGSRWVTLGRTLGVGPRV